MNYLMHGGKILFFNGWVIPLSISILSVISFLQSEVFPTIYEKEKIINSFPYLIFAESSAYIFIIWSVSALVMKLFKPSN